MVLHAKKYYSKLAVKVIDNADNFMKILQTVESLICTFDVVYAMFQQIYYSDLIRCIINETKIRPINLTSYLFKIKKKSNCSI